MINNIMSYIYVLVFFSIFVVVLEMLLPEGKNKKYVNVICGIVLTYLLVRPIINIWTSDEDIKNEIKKEFEELNIVYNDSNKYPNQDEYVKTLFEKAMNNDIKKKIEQCGYEAGEIKFTYDLNEKNELKGITYIECNVKEKKKDEENFNVGYEVQKVSVVVNDENVDQVEINNEDKEKIINNLSEAYKVDRNNICIL